VGTSFRYIVGALIFGEGLDMNCCNEVLTASWRKEDPLEIWNFENGEPKVKVDWNAGIEKKDRLKSSTLLYCCKYSKNFGRLIYAGGSQVNSAKIFDYEGRIVASIDKLSRACLALDSSNDTSNKNYELLALGGGEGIIRVFRVITIPQNA
jgi:COMPASS component SWD3